MAVVGTGGSPSNFFRDPDVVATIEQRVMPRLFEHRIALEQVRIWVPGCATGAEAYALAILAAECTQRLVDDERPAVRIFGSDVDAHAIARARDGSYTDTDVAGVSAARLQRFFEAAHGGYRIHPDVRRSVMFAHHHVLSDPPFANLDFISCRNLLTALDRSAQHRVLQTFHFALRPGGFLLLGPGETPPLDPGLFEAVDARAHLYQTRAVTGRQILPLAAAVPSRITAARDAPGPSRTMPADLHQRLLDEYAGASLVVNGRHEVVHVSAAATRYLRATAGEPSRDLFRMAAEDLRADLRQALREALGRRTDVEVSPVPVRLDAGNERVRLRVRPVFRPVTGEPLFLVLLAPVDAAADLPQSVSPRGVAAGGAATGTELAHLKVELEETIERYESEAAAARAAYEDVQSVNEQLTTVNQELRARVEELAREATDSTEPSQVVELLRQVVRGQEDERARIARDLHDELGQQLTELRLALQRHRDTCASRDGGMAEAFEVISRIDTNVDFLARELRPPELDNLGLAAALDRHVREWAARTGVQADVNVIGITAGTLPADVEVMYYRIAQEALNNVARHARATRVDVILDDRQGPTIMIVEDDGVGFDPSQHTGSLGLLGMRERAALVGATLEIESTPGQGSTIFLRYPGRQPAETPA